NGFIPAQLRAAVGARLLDLAQEGIQPTTGWRLRAEPDAPGPDDLRQVIFAVVGQLIQLQTVSAVAGPVKIKVDLPGKRGRGPTTQARAAAQRLVNGRPALAQHGQNVVTQVVAIELWREIGRITNTVQRMICEVGLDLLALPGKQRSS